MKKNGLTYNVCYETHRDKPSSYEVKVVGNWKQVQLMAKLIDEVIDDISENKELL